MWTENIGTNFEIKISKFYRIETKITFFLLQQIGLFFLKNLAVGYITAMWQRLEAETVFPTKDISSKFNYNKYEPVTNRTQSRYVIYYTTMSDEKIICIMIMRQRCLVTWDNIRRAKLLTLLFPMISLLVCVLWTTGIHCWKSKLLTNNRNYKSDKMQ